MAVGASASTPDSLIVTPDADLKAPAFLTQQQMLADLDVMQYAASAGYAGPDLAAVLQQIRVEVPAFLDSLSFCRLVENHLMAIRDSHLRADLIGQSCGGRRPLGHVGTNLRAAAGTWGAFVAQGRTVVAIPQFPLAADPSWKGFADQIRALKAAGQSFVLDLRGNTGGDDDPACQLARILYGLSDDEPMPTPVEARLSRETPEAFALMSNSWSLDIQRLKRLGQKVPDYDYQMRNRALAWMEKAKSGKYPPVDVENLPQPDLSGHDVFQAPVYVLIDNQCASSCELMLEFLEALPHRVLIGENTMGAVAYGEVGKLVLPYSRAIITLATFSNRYRDYRQVEGLGYAPDIAVTPDTDALAVALARP